MKAYTIPATILLRTRYSDVLMVSSNIPLQYDSHGINPSQSV